MPTKMNQVDGVVLVTWLVIFVAMVTLMDRRLVLSISRSSKTK